jgi:2'-5' RNA ligase
VPDAPGVRAFVALALDREVQAAVEAATDELRRDLAGAVRWVPTATLHVTVRFLGDVLPDTLERLRRELAERTAPSGPFDLLVAGAGAFPPRGRPRVLWVGIEPTPALADLHARVEDACEAAGLAREARAFRPHVTVGRPRPGAAFSESGVRGGLGRVGFVAAQRVASLHLMRSDLSPAGARHSTLAHAPFGAAAPEPPAAR